MKQFVVIGLGRFGVSVATELYRMGHEVLAIDRSVERVEEIADSVTHAVCADATDEAELGSLGLRNFDVAVVSIGSDLLEAVMIRICDCLYKWGVRRFVFLNGHGGNTHALEKACAHLDRRGAVGAIINWWVVAGELNSAWKGGHGAGEETAAMLAVDPTLVRRDLISDPEIVDPTPAMKASGLRKIRFRGVDIPLPRTNRKIAGNGWYGSDLPESATEKWGVDMLNATADFIAAFMEEFEKVPLADQ